MTVLVDKLEKELARNCRLNNWDLGFQAAIDIVKQHDKWVPVSERLPSESGNYLVYRYNGKTNNWEVTIEYFCTQSEWFKPYRSINNITHWRRLPQPQRGVQNV